MDYGEAREIGLRAEALTRVRGLRKLCGYVEDGSSDKVTICQDDATRTWVVTVGRRQHYGTTFEAAIDAAIKAEAVV